MTTLILGRFVICRLGLAMFKPHTRFEVSMITCYKVVTGNAKCRNNGGLGWLRVTQYALSKGDITDGQWRL